MKTKKIILLSSLSFLFLSGEVNFSYSQVKTRLEFNLTLRDGSIVSGTSSINKVNLTTDYGKLEIPIKNVSSIEVGINAGSSNTEKINKLIVQLSNSNEQMRSSAYAELRESGIEAIPVISRFVYSEKFDPAIYTDNSPENILNELLANFGLGSDFSEKDIVSVDNQFTMGGEFPFEKIDLKTEYGDLSIPKNKIKRIEVLYSEEGSGSDRIFKLMASKHISGNTFGGWLNTGINIKNGQKIDISASGEVTLASLSGQKYKPGGPVVNSGVPDNYDDYGVGNYNYPAYGNVVYKIGETGTMLKAGDKFSGSAISSGILYLSIYETVYNAANTGTYSVKISVK